MLLYSEVAFLHLSVHGASQPAAAAPAAAAAPPKSSAAAAVQSAPVLEEWQTPLRYRRRPITEEEIEYINVSFALLYVFSFLFSEMYYLF